MPKRQRSIERSDARHDPGSLKAVGITSAGEHIYELLITHPGLSLPDMVVSSGFSRGKLESELTALELKGLVTHSANRTRRYFATPPDVALEALIVKQQDALQQIRLTASRLREKERSSRGARSTEYRLVEVVTGREAQAKIFDQIQRGAKAEIISFDRPPYVIAPSAVNATELEMLSNGVRYKGVYDRSALIQENAVKRIRVCIEAGEESRVFDKVPMKFIGADHHLAMLPLDLQYLDGPALLVRESSLLDALYDLFEVIWDRSSPISFDASALPQASMVTTDVLGNYGQLVSLLASGLNDKAIASQLEISPRTLDRRVKALMEGLDTRTRFQAGWRAGYVAAKNDMGNEG